jgi:plastocyanin
MHFKQIIAASLLAGVVSAVAPGYGAGINAVSSAPSVAPTVAPTVAPIAATSVPVPVPSAVATPAPAPGGATGGKVITVNVGAGGLTYTPNNITANIGDTVMFVWAAGASNHTVTQSTKETICTKKDAATAFISGNHNGPFTFNVSVTDTAPMWFFCAIGKHCQGGMYGVINSPAGSTFPAPNAAAPAPAPGGSSGTPSTPSTTESGAAAPAPGTKVSGASTLSVMSTSGMLAGALAIAAYLL